MQFGVEQTTVQITRHSGVFANEGSEHSKQQFRTPTRSNLDRDAGVSHSIAGSRHGAREAAGGRRLGCVHAPATAARDAVVSHGTVLVGRISRATSCACRRIAPGTRRISRGKESSKGLNTESNNPQRSTATVLVGLAGGEHCRDERTVLPRFRALLER